MSKEIDELNFPDQIRYTAEHVWAKQEDDRCTSGITDFAQDQLGEIVYVELPDTDDFFEAGEVFGTVESMKTISELFMPLNGKILAVNSSLADKPEIINQDPHGKGWMIKFELSDNTEFLQLITAETYTKGIKDL
jgi:glycine cleavage system H protein